MCAPSPKCHSVNTLIATYKERQLRQMALQLAEWLGKKASLFEYMESVEQVPLKSSQITSNNQIGTGSSPLGPKTFK